MFQLRVQYDGGVLCSVHWFDTEREARLVLNFCADGRTVFTICDTDGVIVESRFPVLMVA